VPWARASTLERHLECSASCWLPRLERGVWRPGYLVEGIQVLPPLPDEVVDTSAADHGTAMHAAKAGVGVDPYQAVVDPFREQFWPSNLGVHEQLVAYNCRTRAIDVGPANVPQAEGDAWKDSHDTDWIVGTCDWWANLPSGEPWVSDLKTGWRKPEVVTPQTLFYLLLKCRVDRWNIGRLSIDHWPKAADAPSREGLWRQVSGLVLDSFEDDLQRAWRRTTQQPNPAARPGPWCTYCPSMGTCPAGQTGTSVETAA
jgi:hypothetical protein